MVEHRTHRSDFVTTCIEDLKIHEIRVVKLVIGQVWKLFAGRKQFRALERVGVFLAAQSRQACGEAILGASG